VQFDLPDLPRESVPFAFLGPDVIDANGFGVNGRKLQLLVRSTAIDLLWDKDIPNKVIGVRYSRDGEAFEVFAKKEVIVSAGFLSPTFLQRNGIGPVSVLNNAGVPLRVQNEHVGQRVTNHVGIQALFASFVVENGQVVPVPIDVSFPEDILPVAPGAMLPVSVTTPNPERQMQWISIGGAFIGQPSLLVVAGFDVTPQSIGTMNIQNDDPFKIPLYDNGYLRDPENPEEYGIDLQNLKTALRETLLGLQNFFADPAHPTPNGATWALISPTVDILNDDAALTDYIIANLAQTAHYATGCPMGSSSATSVVDSHGRVHGVQGLRVADVSILPVIPDGNTCTPAVLVGWTIAELIQQEQAAALTAKKKR
jgi:choline dehydrogenase